MNPYEEAKQAYDDALELARIADLACQNAIQIHGRAAEHVADASVNLAKFEEKAGIPKTQYRASVDQTMIISDAMTISRDRHHIPLGSSDNPSPDCGGPRRPSAATELWYCDTHSEFHAIDEEDDRERQQ
jgi:hypothetical protein